MATKLVRMSIEEEYSATHPTSEKLYRRALSVMPSGIGHDSRRTKPFPIFINGAAGAKKWDVDGNEYVDLWCGHGGLLLGHCHPDVVAAVAAQIQNGFHFSALNEIELELAEMVTRLIPCAESVRWMQSGTEANMLAIRIARAYTGKNKVIKFRGHFHGYWNEGILAVLPPYNAPMSIGVPKENLSNVLLAAHNSSEDVRQLIEETNDVACVIMDPICHAFVRPNRPGFLEEIRQITREKGIVLIYDEVVSAFRLAPGSAQEAFGVIPDLATISKTLGNGLPISAVVGKKEIMDVVAFKDDPVQDRLQRVISQGTHSGNAVTCAGSLATLKILSTGKPQAHMNNIGAMVRKSLNQVIKKHDIPACVYGNYSIGRIFVSHDCPYVGSCDVTNCTYPDDEKADAGTPAKVRGKLYLAMLLNGVDYMQAGTYWLNAAITEEDVAKITDAFDRSLARLKEEKVL